MIFDRGKADPAALDGLRATLAGADPDGRLSELGMQRVEIGPDVLDLLPECIAGLIGEIEEPRVVLVTDATAITRSGEDLKAQVEATLSERYERVERAVVRGRHEQLHTDEDALSEAEGAVAGADCVVVVGSGTITDICKVAVHRSGGSNIVVVVQTAASVDGFSDDVSVVLKSGVKRTIPSRWPEVLIADLTTISEAPAAMTAAGYGDAISMYTAPADWRLASLMGIDGSYHHAPVAMLLEGGPDVISAAEGIGNRDPQATEKLVRVLALRGMASGVSGSTAILSGAEHVISHMLDMHAGQTGTPLGVHGAQVGVAVVVAAAAWQTFLEDFDPAKVDIDSCFPQPEEMEPVVRAAFADLDPSGAVGEECWSDYGQKLKLWHENRTAFESFLAYWPRHREELEKLVADPDEIAKSLSLVGAPARFGELRPELSPETARWALNNCHFMRNRFNVVDLLYFTGWWDEAFVERLLERVRPSGGGI